MRGERDGLVGLRAAESIGDYTEVLCVTELNTFGLDRGPVCYGAQ